MKTHWNVLRILVLVWVVTPGAWGQGAARPDLPALFEKREVMIAMRDGVKLHAEIYAPKNAKEALPIFLERTPYGISADDKGYSPKLYRYSHMFADGYVFVFQDIRGRYGSEGQFVMNRPVHDAGNPKGVDESTDTYDTIEWLVKNVPNNNGRVGTAGISYGGFLAAMALVNPHPALKAVSEQACMGDTWLGDDFFHNGAFRLSYGYEYATEMESTKENFKLKFDRDDLYEWYLHVGPLSNINRDYLHGKIPSWNSFVEHPAYDEFWKEKSLAHALHQATVPNLNVAGWWDQEDFYGPMATYANLEKNDTAHMNYLVVGPWNHGGWAHGPGNWLGQIPFASDTGEYFREKVEAPWFAYWLHDKGELPLKEALLFQTGSNTWTRFDAWPPQDAQQKSLYFGADGKLSFDAPKTDAAEAFDSYVSDPANPVPYRNRPVDETYPSDHPGRWYTWLVQDQRFVEKRPEVLSWKTDVLPEDVTLTGQVTAKLFAATTGSDADWVVKLIDVYPDKPDTDWNLSSYELMIADEIFRGRYRNSYEKPEAIVPGEITPFTIDLHTADHVFKKGHRIMVEVQSTWFPLYDRNPQKFVPNIFEAKESDYQKATQKIYRSQAHPSHLEISVPGGAAH
ncbi:MAG TPA: CocE/NonD family hydrolase [Candidatus Acidoferrum sp.]|jgi:putative CocE/NonD family hydrolase|nr:CocE/NonD family hydrolase [Candidatus Acidoferrum sp.]